MTRRELTAWLLAAFFLGSIVTPRASAYDTTGMARAIWAVRNAIARNCEVAAQHHNTRSSSWERYDAQRCWR